MHGENLKLTYRILETENGTTRSHSMENSLWKGLWPCRKTDYGMIEPTRTLGPTSQKTLIV